MRLYNLGGGAPAECSRSDNASWPLCWSFGSVQNYFFFKIKRLHRRTEFATILTTIANSKLCLLFNKSNSGLKISLRTKSNIKSAMTGGIICIGVIYHPPLLQRGDGALDSAIIGRARIDKAQKKDNSHLHALCGKIGLCWPKSHLILFATNVRLPHISQFLCEFSEPLFNSVIFYHHAIL